AGRHARAAEEKNPEEAGLEEEGGERLVREQRPLDRPRHPRQLAPIGAQLERHHDTGDDTETESDAENLEPEFEDTAIRRTTGDEVQCLENRQPCRQADRERRKDDVKRYSERKLQPRQ